LTTNTLQGRRKMAKKKSANEISAMTAEIQLAIETPERLAWRQALIEGNLQKIKDQWFESFARLYDLTDPVNRYYGDYLDRAGTWVLGPFPDDRTFQLSMFLSLEKSKQPHVRQATLAIEPMFFASPMEVAMRRSDKELFNVLCEVLRDGKYYRQYSNLPDTWSFGGHAFNLNPDDVVGSKFGPSRDFLLIASSIFILAFLLDDGDAYLALLRAGLDDIQMIRQLSQYLDSCKEEFPGAIESFNEVLEAHGYSGKTLSQWNRFCDFRRCNQMNLEKSLFDYSEAKLEELSVARSAIRGLLLSAPSVSGAHLAAATVAGDLELVKDFFDAGVLPNAVRDVGHSWFARLAESMDERMLTLWLDSGANPMLGDTKHEFDGFVSQTALFTLVWHGKTELVKLCLTNARKPMPITWVEREDGEEQRDVLPFNELADFALQRAQKVPERGPEFERVASILRNEPARQDSIAFATELDSLIREAPSGGRGDGHF
jgi:hypothetical protein